MDYERLFNNRALVPEHPHILSRWSRDGADAVRRLACLLDLPYGEHASERLDFFPARVSSRGALPPLLIFMHGGWWRSLDKRDFAWLAAPWQARGVSVALPNYALCPAVSLRDIVQQTCAAVAWLYGRAGRYEFDPQRIHIAGHSAGGHLAAMMLAARWPQWGRQLPADLIKSAMAVSGLFELAPVRKASFVNQDLQLNEADCAALSPARLPPATDAPLIVATGALESAAFFEQQDLMLKAWKGVARGPILLEGDNHFTACDRLAEPGHPLFEALAAEIARPH
jgi:arylformamidase